MNEVKGM